MSPGGCNDGPAKVVTIIINPSPRLEISATKDTLCNNGTSVLQITTPTSLNSGEVIFDYSIDESSGGLEMISGYTTQSGVTIPGSGPVIISQTLTNHTNEVQWIRFRFHPYAKNTGSTADCDGGNLYDTLITIIVEPTPNATAFFSNNVVCNSSPLTYSLSTTTTAIYGVRFDVRVVNPYPEVTGVSDRTGLTDLDIITDVPFNSEREPRMVLYIITPSTIAEDGSNKCPGINDTIRLWINPTPEVIPVNVKPICSEGLTDISLVTPTKMTSGVINFDYFVTVTGGAGDIIGNTMDGNDLLHGDKISRAYQNNSDTIQSVNFWITASNDLLGCIGDTVRAEVQVHARPLQDLIISKPLTCDGGSDATLAAVIAKGASPDTIVFKGPSGYYLKDVTDETIYEVSNLEGGGYQVIVTDNLGCVNSMTVWPVGALLDSYLYVREKASGYGTTCNGSDDGEIWIRQNNSSTGIAPFEYWVVYNDQDTVIHDFLYEKGVFNRYYNLAPGHYTLHIRDANGCYDNSYPVVEIKNPDDINVTFEARIYDGEFNVSCKGYSDGEVKVKTVTGGSGGYSYHWYRPPSEPPLTVDTNESILDSISAGKYYLRITDIMGCVKVDSITLTEPDGMTLEGYELSHSPDNNFNISCNGAGDGFINLSIIGGSGNYTYLWVGPDDFTSTTRDISGLKAGAYKCTVTDVNGCILVPEPEYTLEEPDILEITAVAQHSDDGFYNINCFGGTGEIDITVSGGSPDSYVYTWTTNNGSGLIEGQADQDQVTAGNYHLIVTDANGCKAEAEVELTQPEELILELIPTHITCQSMTFDNGSVNLVLSGGIEPYSYEWSNGATLQDISGLTEGTYSVTVTDANGCTKTESTYVSLPPDLEFSRTVSDYNGYNISCYGRSDGNIQITPTSGQEPYIYEWQLPDGSTSDSKDLTGLQAGDYALLITDSNMCTVSDTIRLTEPPGKITMNVTEQNINCSGDYTGSILVEAVNNAGSVDYLWADGVVGSYRNGLPAGPYRIIITDSNNCQADSTIILTEPAPLELSFAVNQPLCTDMPDGSIMLTVTGGTGSEGYTYLWSDGSFTRNIATAVSGWYSVIVSDINNCTVRDSVFISPQRETCLVIPNAISPNGDLINDEWNIGLKELYPQMEVKIYNRWGELLWKSEKGYPRPWDGRSKGSVLPIDSYHYTIDLHNGMKPIIGHVTIVR